MRKPTTPRCPNAGNHVPHPTSYVAHSGWADNALLVADQKQCEGCGAWKLWVPKRADLRVAAWPTGSCDWGNCDDEAVAERFDRGVGEWLPVCARHTGIGPPRATAPRGICANCVREYALTGDGRLRLHRRGFGTCPGSGHPPRGDARGGVVPVSEDTP